jgi:predicted dehydrogenase
LELAMAFEAVRVGVVGCGNISGIYLKNCASYSTVRVVACADLDVGRARAKAAEHAVPRACTPAELLADPDVEIVLNLTTPGAHAGVALDAVRAGKSVYNEKPLTIDLADARRLLDQARSRGVLVGGAPDTFLGAGLQTCRDLLDATGDDSLGEPVAATAFMTCHGHESWHPDPAFYYDVGGGPMFDMGPYYLTALVSLMGPVARVTGSARATFPERTITSEPRRGQTIPVRVPTHVAGILEFHSGAIGTILTSFDVWHANLPCIEVYTTRGSLSVPDPNGFGGPVRMRGAADAAWRDVPLRRPFPDNSRGLGVADMARRLRMPGPPHRAGGELALHVLEIMHAVHDASRTGTHQRLTTTCDRPEPLDPAWRP